MTYRTNQSEKRVLFVGKSPPPVGGVTVYVKRVSSSLKGRTFFKYLNTGKEDMNLDFFQYFSFIRKNNIGLLHLNGFIKGLAALRYYILKKITGAKIIVTYHNDRFREVYYRLNMLDRLFARIFYRNIHTLISVKKDVDYLFVNRSRIVNISPFIEPLREEVEAEIPEVIQKFRERHKRLLTANASKVAFHKNEDLYGIDLAIELMRRLVQNGRRDTGFLYMIANNNNNEYLDKMRLRIKEFNLEEHFQLITNPIQYPAVLKISDIFIRPTNTDGDALSVREALSMNIPTIASDICNRPEGSILFMSRNPEDLLLKTERLLSDYEAEKRRISGVFMDDGLMDLLHVYESLLGRNLYIDESESINEERNRITRQREF